VIHTQLTVMAAALAWLGVAPTAVLAHDDVDPSPAHTRIQFSFTANGPYDRAAPLFGAHEESKWAAGWEPRFLHPAPAKDQPGAVFLVKRGQNLSVWTTTAFDLPGGHVQYVYVMNGALVTLIDIHLTHEGREKTGVSVVYERTALTPEANDQVAQLAEQDKGFRKEWEDEINEYLDRTRGAGRP